VGWFNCDQWGDQDYKKQQAPKISITEAQEQFDVQAKELSQSDVRVKAFVMSTGLR
jgi:hypothetical protein